MNPDVVYTDLGIIVGVLTLLGAGAKFVLLPWLQRELFGPVQRTHHQVTVNHHSSDEPTVLDRLDDVQAVASRAAESARRAESAANRARDDLSDHLLNSERVQTEGHKEAQRMWSAIEAIAKTEPPKDA